MNAALGLYDRDHSEKEYWVWESDGSEANFTHWDSYSNKLETSELESNGCVILGYNVDSDAVWNDDYNAEETTMDWTKLNCYSNTFPVLCQRIVAYDYDCKYGVCKGDRYINRCDQEPLCFQTYRGIC